MDDLSQSKHSLNGRDGHKHKDKGCYIMVQKWEDSPERHKLAEIWEKHGSTILSIALTIALLIYTVVAIGISGFEKVKWMFALTMFLWFCMAYMLIRDNCGAQIYRGCLQPMIELIKKAWPVLRW